MKATQTLMALTVAGLCYHHWSSRAAMADGGIPGDGPFVQVQMPDGAQRNKVLILAPLNCPSAGAKRADALASRLTQMGIPNERSNSYMAHPDMMTAEAQTRLKRTSEVLGGKIPAVFINGMGKDDPSADQVAAVYRDTQ